METKRYSIKCGCGNAVAFGRSDIADLDRDWTNDVADAEQDCDQGNPYFFGDDNHIDVTSVEGVPVLEEMATAIRRRDWSEAEILLDRLARVAGNEAQEQVAKGRCCVRAKAA